MTASRSRVGRWRRRPSRWRGRDAHAPVAQARQDYEDFADLCDGWFAFGSAHIVVIMPLLVTQAVLMAVLLAFYAPHVPGVVPLALWIFALAIFQFFGASLTPMASGERQIRDLSLAATSRGGKQIEELYLAQRVAARKPCMRVLVFDVSFEGIAQIAGFVCTALSIIMANKLAL